MKLSIPEYYKLTKRPGRIRHDRTAYRGQMFDSKREADYCAQLDQARRAVAPGNRVVSYERQVKYPVVLNGKNICFYLLDFLVHFADGHKEYVDVKGHKTDVYKIKKKLVEAQYSISIVEP